MKKILLSFMLVMFSFILLAGFASACGYHDHKTCKVDANTIIEGKITLNDAAAGKAQITVTCYHGGTDYTRTTKSVNYGILKGTYLVTFPQSQCKATDTVTVTAKAQDGSIGTATGIVKDFIKEKCLDMDVAIINVKIPTVPEFGLIAGALTIFGALGAFFVVRRK